MFDYGNGSDGALNATTGFSFLALNTKHQFTSVYIGPEATLSSNSSTGSVMYITATESITIDGTLTLSSIINTGRNTWSVEIDGETYSSPGVANGGSGGNNLNGANGGSQSNGFGGGGAAGSLTGAPLRGGHGGSGSSNPANGAGSRSIGAVAGIQGNDGVRSAGGSGGASTQGGSSATSGRGGHAYSGHGGDGSVSGGGAAGGGGGAGGSAGRAGVHIVLRAPSVKLNGTILTDGTAGGSGGAGGTGRTTGQATGYNVDGSGGGGGGGGHAGSIYIAHSKDYTNNATIEMSGGPRGNRGFGKTIGGYGVAGLNGSMSVSIAPDGPDISGLGLSSDNITLIPDTRLSSNSATSTLASPDLVVVEGAPKVPVEITGYGGGYGSAVPWGGHSYGIAMGVTAENQELVLDDNYIDHLVDRVDLLQQHLLSSSSTLHGHSVSSPLIKQVHNLLIDSTEHYYDSPELLLVEHYTIDPEGSVIAHRAENLSLSGAAHLGVQDALHSLSTPPMAFTQWHSLVSNSTTHNHLADSLAVSEGKLLSILNTAHSLYNDSIWVTQEHKLATSAAVHGLLSGELTLAQIHNLLTQGATHSHDADGNINLVTFTLLGVPDSAVHALTSPQFSLSQTHILETLKTLHTLTDSIDEITNWSEYNKHFGRYRQAYGDIGNLDEYTTPEAGRYKERYKQDGTLRDVDIPTGRYKEKYKSSGRLK